MSEETAIVPVQGNPLALLDDIDLDDILGHRLPVPVRRENGQHPWVYEFEQKGQKVVGVSIDGVNDAARALAARGETIRELWVRTEREDEQNAYFLACAARYAISPDGQEICLDTVIRAKRQPKFTKRRDGTTLANENWYEVGVAKATRNAKEALLPEAVKQWLIAQAQGSEQAPRGRPALSVVQSPPPEQKFASATREGKLWLSAELARLGLNPKSRVELAALLGLADVPDMPLADILTTIEARQSFAQDAEPVDAEVLD